MLPLKPWPLRSPSALPPPLGEPYRTWFSSLVVLPGGFWIAAALVLHEVGLPAGAAGLSLA